MEIDIGGFTYKIGKLSAFDKLYIAKRVAPALWAMAKTSLAHTPASPPPAEGTAAEAAPVEQAQPPKLDDSDALLAFQPVVEAVSQMKDEDLKLVITLCLSACHRKVGDQWAPVMTKGRGFMFENDIDMPEMLQIAYAVIQENLGNFSRGLLPGV